MAGRDSRGSHTPGAPSLKVVGMFWESHCPIAGGFPAVGSCVSLVVCIPNLIKFSAHV